jgi:hypothetical protein
VYQNNQKGHKMIPRLQQALQLLEDGNYILDTEFENNDDCPYDQIFIAIQHIKLAIRLLNDEPEYSGN